ncbi:MAG: UvrABC system protein A [Owenweeksia sp. TMED14]|nr:MAG: UvrABC system protein A [Owenweeksia sp. TMED14]
MTKLNKLKIIGARVNNLKNINIEFPHGHLVVITGVSGSGKSSLAFDTLYAEGQRRYVESLSSYARQFLGKLDKPEVDNITGLAPAIAIQQKVISRNPRSTVGTVTELHDYLKVLFAKIGKTYSPISGNEVKRHQNKDVLNRIKEKKESLVLIISPLNFEDRTKEEMCDLLIQQGYSRIIDKIGTIYKIEDIPESTQIFSLVVDRMHLKDLNEETINRANDSIQTAFFEGQGELILRWENGAEDIFSNRFNEDGIDFDDPSPALFSFNTPQGACPECEGFGSLMGIDKDLVIPDKNLSVYENAIAPWRGEKLSKWKNDLILGSEAADMPIHKPINQLTVHQEQLIWDGCKHFKGINDFFRYVESKIYKIQFRVLQARYRGKTICPDCGGKRLRKEAQYVKIEGISIAEILSWSVSKASIWFNELNLKGNDIKIAERLLIEIKNRLNVLEKVGLHYLTLERPAGTLSGGESQRIHLATSLGSSLIGSIYILDEPSIGLHPRDAQKLLEVLFKLRDMGNTVIVVEHDSLFMKSADTLIDIGPKAGLNGGHVIYSGPGSNIQSSKSLTAQYLKGEKKVSRSALRIKQPKTIGIRGAVLNNLKKVDIDIPLGHFSVVCGVSGSGKTSLIRNVLVPAIQKHLGERSIKANSYETLVGEIAQINSVEVVDQNPMGKSSRSNPVTYLKIYDDIRTAFASTKNAQLRGLKPKHFSFNTEGGRCDICKGDGFVTIEMQFMADVHLKCEHCNGDRFQDDVLDVEINSQNIAQILRMTIDEAYVFFNNSGLSKIATKLQPLIDVGLGYLQLGQTSSTLSGGEGQRVKLAYYLSKGNSIDPIFFVFDEPTTGLHFDDVQKLLDSFNALIALGHTVLVIEHHTDVISNADWVIELGPEGGDDGGYLLFQGALEDFHGIDKSPTLVFLEKN